jgi:hypothetical protein
MVFIETPSFTRLLGEILTDEEYTAFQRQLLANPEAGALIPGTGGLRKLRASAGGKGKRGGARVIYFLNANSEHCYLLLIYKKNTLENPSPSQLRQLRIAMTQSNEE